MASSRVSALMFFWSSIIASLLLWDCCQAQSHDILQHCIKHFDPTVNYYQPLVQQVVSATEFTISYGYYYKIVRNQRHNLTYLLHQCGSPVPSLTELGLPAVNGTFQLPVRGPATDSTIPVAFMELLGKLRNSTLTPDAAEFIASPCVRKYLANRKIRTVPDAGNSSDAIFTAASGQPSSQTNAVSFDATFDGGPLKRAEWIKYMAAFFNAEHRARNIFCHVYVSYQCLNGSRSDSYVKPTVAWLSFFNGVWTISGAAYKMQLDLDAGGINLNADVLGKSFDMSNQTDLDSFHRILRSVDAVVDESFAPDPFSYTLQNFTENAMLDTAPLDYPFLTSNRVIRVDKRVGSNFGLDWFEMAIPQPHVVLYDLINMLYPSQTFSSTYLRNIALGEIPVNVTAERCTRPINRALKPTVIPDPEVEVCAEAAGTSMY